MLLLLMREYIFTMVFARIQCKNANSKKQILLVSMQMFFARTLFKATGKIVLKKAGCV